jgi:hypothetical protein
MDLLSAFLAEEFQIIKQADDEDTWAQIQAHCSSEIFAEYARLNDARAFGDAATRNAADRRFYDLICENPALLGSVHSQKWPFILDAAAFIGAFVRCMNISKGFFVDVGCHAGYHSIYLAKNFQMRGQGIDLSKKAVRFAREKGKRLGVTPSRVTFDATELHSEPRAAEAHLVFSVDGGIQFSPSSLGRARKHLRDDGFLVWIGANGVPDAVTTRTVLANAGLELVLADVLGGWNGQTFGANTVFVLRAGRDPCVPESLGAVTEEIWNEGFKDYSNDPGRLSSEKTVGYFRTFATFGPRPLSLGASMGAPATDERSKH